MTAGNSTLAAVFCGVVLSGLALTGVNAAIAAGVSTTFSKTSPTNRNALVELFTSDGCDACPPANKWISEVLSRADPRIIPVSMHVTYWDSLGWVDPAGNRYFDQKQDHYTRLGLAKFSYTPAVFLSGSEWSGWRNHDMQKVKAIAQQAAPVVIELKATVDTKIVKIQIQIYPTSGATEVAPASLSQSKQVVYLYEDEVIDQPNAGELSGVTLRHDHVVKKWDERTIQALPNQADVQFDIPQDADRKKLGVIAFLQRQDSREIFQVIDLRLQK